MLLLRLISRLPFPLLYLLSDFIFFVSYRVVRYRVKMVKKNLRNSFPEKPEPELREIEKKFYRNLADYGVEMVKLLTITPEEFHERVTVKNLELIERYGKEGKSVLGLASHQFNWEWILTYAGLVAPMPIDFVYQPVNSSFFEKFSKACRSRFGAHPIKRNDVAKEAFKRRNLVRIVSIVADQYPGHSRDKRYITRFLNQETAFFDGTNQLAVMTQYPVTFWKIARVKRGHYEITIEPVIEPPFKKGDTRPVELYVRKLEEMIRKHPDNWLWSHNRWKTRHLETQTQAEG